jgi:hypothetical protein
MKIYLFFFHAELPTDSNCNETEFFCDEKCVSNDHKCDAVQDCEDNSDEKGCPERSKYYLKLLEKLSLQS